MTSKANRKKIKPRQKYKNMEDNSQETLEMKESHDTVTNTDCSLAVSEVSRQDAERKQLSTLNFTLGYTPIHEQNIGTFIDTDTDTKNY